MKSRKQYNSELNKLNEVYQKLFTELLKRGAGKEALRELIMVRDKLHDKLKNRYKDDLMQLNEDDKFKIKGD